MKFKSLRDLSLSGQRVLMRVDFNVPQDKQTGAITNTARIAAALPTDGGRDGLSEEDKRVLALWGPNVSVIVLREAPEKKTSWFAQASSGWASSTDRDRPPTLISPASSISASSSALPCVSTAALLRA